MVFLILKAKCLKNRSDFVSELVADQTMIRPWPDKNINVFEIHMNVFEKGSWQVLAPISVKLDWWTHLATSSTILNKDHQFTIHDENAQYCFILRLFSIKLDEQVPPYRVLSFYFCILAQESLPRRSQQGVADMKRFGQTLAPS